MASFLDFPFDFDSNSNLLNDSLELALERLPNQVREAITSDVVFLGCYPHLSLLRKSMLFLKSRRSSIAMTQWLEHQKGFPRLHDAQKLQIWVTFENRRIPNKHVDLGIGFDFHERDSKFLYMPLIFFYIDFLSNGASYVRHPVSFSELKQPRFDFEIPVSQRRFACAFINNPDPVRLRFIDALRNFGEVDIFGRSTGNYVKNKIEITNEYRFTVCFENDLFPGYVTEKPLEAWLGKAVPIYWGLDNAGILNPEAVINCSDFPSLQDAVTFVGSIKERFDLLEKYIRQPLFSRNLEAPKLVDFLYHGILNSGKFNHLLSPI